MAEARRHFIADASPWVPESNPHALMHLGKLGEELAECGSVVSRCIIQGIGEAEPSTGEVNRDWLTKEIGDVLANITMVRKFFALDADAIDARVAFKIDYLRRWHSLPIANLSGTGNG